jgi:hypothetical protein
MKAHYVSHGCRRIRGGVMMHLRGSLADNSKLVCDGLKIDLVGVSEANKTSGNGDLVRRESAYLAIFGMLDAHDKKTDVLAVVNGWSHCV